MEFSPEEATKMHYMARKIRESDDELFWRKNASTIQTNHQKNSMQISKAQAAVISLLCRLLNARFTLDIGTYTGYSAYAAARAMPEDGHVITCEVYDNAMTDHARAMWDALGVADKIELHLRRAVETLEDLLNKNTVLDFIFLDENYGEKGYQQYYEQCLKLLRPGGVLLCDNTFWLGKIFGDDERDPRTGKMREFNDFVAKDERVLSLILPIVDGMTVIHKLGDKDELANT